jgi:beta-fructofuranosidase
MDNKISMLLFQNNKFLIFIYLLFNFSLLSGQVIAKFSFEEETGSEFVLDSVSQEQFPVVNHFNRPERINGVLGNALRLDGFSTWSYKYPWYFENIESTLTLEAWYATEAFNFEYSSIISQESINSGFSLSIGRFGNVSLTFFADGTKYELITEQSIDKYSWNHIVAVIDLDEQFAAIYVNGVLWENHSLNSHNGFTLANNQSFFIGRHSVYEGAGGFPVMTLNGALDELVIYNTALSINEIIERYQLFEGAVPDLSIDPAIRHEGDHLRPQYHAMPNTGWTNESYGLTWHNGKYHMFFQKNPNAPQLFFMHWGHLSSPDLVDWKEERIALAPSPGFDGFGVWSGTTIMNIDEEPVIFYTGVDGVKAGIGGASKQDDSLLVWEKFVENPLISAPPQDYNHMDFRDPYIWKDGPIYYMIVGSGLQNDGGGILFSYKSYDLIDWEPINPIYSENNTSISGIFWEMPFFVPISDDEYLLSVTPVPTPEKPAETLYWVGIWDDEVFIPYNSEPKKWELIQGNLLSPSISRDENNRLTYIGIIPEDRSTASQIEAGWRHTFSIPRVIRLLKDKKTIGQIPHPNLCRLRDNGIRIENRQILPDTEFNIPEVEGVQVELMFKLFASENSKFEIHVLKNSDESENTKFLFDLANNRIVLDRRFSTLSDATKDYREADYVFDYNDTIIVNVFIDHSVLEVFIDNIVVFSSRVYPSKQDSNLMDLIVHSGQVTIIGLDVWQLKSFGDEMEDMVCEPYNLPDSLRPVTEDETSILNFPINPKLKAYPNPATNEVFILGKGFLRGKILFYDIKGREVPIQPTILNDEKVLFDVGNIKKGIYFLVFVVDQEIFRSEKIIVI